MDYSPFPPREPSVPVIKRTNNKHLKSNLGKVGGIGKNNFSILFREEVFMLHIYIYPVDSVIMVMIAVKQSYL